MGIGQLTMTLEALCQSILHLTEHQIPNVKQNLRDEVMDYPQLHTCQTLSVAQPRKQCPPHNSIKHSGNGSQAS
jgi:hypothetical protein